jgi:type I restriction enzyme M protein
MIKGQDPARISLGNSLNNEDGHSGKQFDYCISNPPYGVDWKKYQEPIEKEHETKGFEGRYGAGLPRVSDGSFLFIQHMISKMKPVSRSSAHADPDEGGSRIAVILSGSPLFSGQAGSGESEIRRWILENDWLEGIVAMPDQMFYNTGIGTFVWIISNRKSQSSKGLVRLIDARDLGTKMRKALGDKRKELTSDAINEITHLYENAISEISDSRVKVMKIEEFGYAKLTVERPLRRIWKLDELSLHSIPAVVRIKVADLKHQTFKNQFDAENAFSNHGLSPKEITVALKAIASTDESAEISIGKKGLVEPDPDLRDSEVMPLSEGFLMLDEEARLNKLKELAENHLATEIAPFVPDAWIDHSKTKIGFEIPFMRQFYSYKEPRPVNEIKVEIEDLESEIQLLMRALK